MLNRQINFKFQIFNLKNLFVIFVYLIICLFVNLSEATAVFMESPRFKIDSANTTSAAGNKSSTNYKLSDTIGQIAAGEFSSTGYVVKAGFQYLRQTADFRFTVTNTNISLGNLVPNTPSTATTNLIVYLGGINQYQVTAIEEEPLMTLNGSFIPDTGCDGGNDACAESVAGIWISNSAYGFGYNMSGQDIPADFNTSNKFRPFPDLSNNESPVIVMSATNVSKNRQSTMAFKANISPIQPVGSYQTIINYVATPTF